MKSRVFQVCWILFVAVASLASGQAPTDESQQTGRPVAFVVLTNGNILAGEVDQLGETYRVATATSEIRLPAREVERVVGSLLEAYEAKRAEVHAGRADDHLRLAAWCMRQELWPQAARELNDARHLEAEHPGVPVIERRLEVASRASLRASQLRDAPASETDQAAKEQHATELRELESLAESLPPGVLEDFARHIQPILVNGCAAVGCHSSDDPRKLQLNRDLIRGVANRESTLRNLQNVWDAIDHTNPVYSPLLTQPAVPHGGLPRPVFAGRRQVAYEKLVEWVRTATESNQPHFATVELATHESPATGAPLSEAAPQDAPHFWEVDPAGEVIPPAEVQRGSTPQKFKPRDEFDPEIFNRMRGLKKGATADP